MKCPDEWENAPAGIAALSRCLGKGDEGPVFPLDGGTSFSLTIKPSLRGGGGGGGRLPVVINASSSRGACFYTTSLTCPLLSPEQRVLGVVKQWCRADGRLLPHDRVGWALSWFPWRAGFGSAAPRRACLLPVCFPVSVRPARAVSSATPPRVPPYRVIGGYRGRISACQRNGCSWVKNPRKRSGGEGGGGGGAFWALRWLWGGQSIVRGGPLCMDGHTDTDKKPVAFPFSFLPCFPSFL
jgi:hypothetical protein